MFLVLKHNMVDDIRELIQLIRNNGRPEKLIECIRANLRSLQDRGLIEVRDIDDHDFTALALFQRQPQQPTGLPEASIELMSPKSESWSTELDGCSTADETMEGTFPAKDMIGSLTDTDTRRNLPKHPATYQSPDEFFEALGVDVSSR